MTQCQLYYVYHTITIIHPGSFIIVGRWRLVFFKTFSIAKNITRKHYYILLKELAREGLCNQLVWEGCVNLFLGRLDKVRHKVPAGPWHTFLTRFFFRYWPGHGK